MAKKAYQVTCDPECGFSVTSHDRSEVLEVVHEHGHRAHNMELPASDVEKRVVEIDK